MLITRLKSKFTLYKVKLAMASSCVSLGTFILSGIPSAPREVPKIEVTFDINADGILDVTARDLGTSKEQKITITGSNKITKEEIKRAREDCRRV